MNEGQANNPDKGQMIRLLDVFVIGPLMIWAGYRLRDENLGILLMAAGAGTILLNYTNYVELQKKQEAGEKLLTEELPGGKA
jgi:hypothetical protein